MSQLAFTRRSLDDYRRWLGISDEFRTTLEATYPTREAAIEAMEYGNYVARRDAIRVLGASGDLDAVLRYALLERQSSWIPTLTCEILVQPPLEVLVAWVTHMKPSGDGSRISEVVSSVLPKFHLAHIAQPLVDFLASRKRELKTLSPDILKAIGTSALPQTVTLLAPHAALDTLRTYAQALAAGVARKACRPLWLEYMLGEEHRALDRASASAISAAVALRRLGQPIDTRRVVDWLRQLEQLFGEGDLARPPGRDHVIALRWILFDSGDDSLLGMMLSPDSLSIRHDVAMTLLLRGDQVNFKRWRQTIRPEYPNLVHPPREVYYWPLIDHLQSLGLGSLPRGSDGYLLARAAGVSAPHGWSWRCEPTND